MIFWVQRPLKSEGQAVGWVSQLGMSVRYATDRRHPVVNGRHSRSLREAAKLWVEKLGCSLCGGLPVDQRQKDDVGLRQAAGVAHARGVSQRGALNTG